MIACFYPLDKPKHRDVVKNFALGIGKNAKLYPIGHFLRNKKLPAGTTGVAFAGILRGFGDLYKYCVEHKVPFYYIDHAYLNAGYDTSEKWMRITKNSFTQNAACNNATPNKFNKYFPNVEMLPWKKDRGEYILLIPPTDAVKYVFAVHEWQELVKNEIKKYTNRPIKVREKESKLLLNPDGTQHSWTKTYYDTTVSEDINGAHCVVAYNSNIAVDAALRGVPVFTSENSVAYPISNTISDIENPYFMHREQWLWNIANNQFSRREIMNGTAFDFLKQL